MLINKIFYNTKPFIPRRLQIFVRRRVIAYKRQKYRHIWPIDRAAGEPPQGWQGWPDNRKFALVLSHDVDTQKGHDRCYQLMEIEEAMGFRSAFNFVPEGYNVSRTLLTDLKNRGFEVCVHGLIHDGKLFFSRQIFDQRAERINEYIKEWDVAGFTSPSMHHNLDWMHALNIMHSTSTFDTDPFEPQPDAVGTIFPLWVPNNHETLRPNENTQINSDAILRFQNLDESSQSATEAEQTNHVNTLRPSESIQFCSRSRKAKVLARDIQEVFRGLKVEPDAEFEQKGTFSEGRRGYVELPYTLPQDFTLFILMNEKNIDIWKKKLDWIVEKGGMVLFNSHPDYMNFNEQKNGNEEYSAELYIEFLEYINEKYRDQYWHVLPKDIAQFWKQNYSF